MQESGKPGQLRDADKRRIVGDAHAAVEREIPQISVKALRLPDSASETALMRAFRRRPEVDFDKFDQIRAWAARRRLA